MEEENCENSRRPRNLQALLRFAMEATKAEDALDSSKDHNDETMDPDRRQFLEEAMKALTVDVIEQLQNAAWMIASESVNKDEKLKALDTILDYIDDMDTAIDFCKIGGLYVLIPCLTSPFPEIRSKSALLIAELAQNNPYCQKELLELDALPKLMTLLCENNTVIAGLRAVSCLVRGYEPCLEEFIKVGGLECLLGCIWDTNIEKVITRSAFFLNSLCVDFPDIREDLVKLKATELIIPLIQPMPEYSIRVESLLSLLCTLTKNVQMIECSKYSEFKKVLEEIIDIASSKPEFEETIQYSRILLNTIFAIKQNTENSDR